MSELKYLISNDKKTFLYSFDMKEPDLSKIESNSIYEHYDMKELLNSGIIFENFNFYNLKNGSSVNGFPVPVLLVFLNGEFYEAKFYEYYEWIKLKREFSLNELL